MFLHFAYASIYWLFLQHLSLSAAETHVFADLSEVRVDMDYDYRSWVNFPTQFRQHDPPRVGLGPKLLVVLITGVAVFYPIELIKPTHLNVFLRIRARTDTKLRYDSRCQVFEDKPTVECHWGLLGGRNDRRGRNYQTIDPLIYPGYTQTSNAQCMATKTRLRDVIAKKKKISWRKPFIDFIPVARTQMSPSALIKFDSNSQAAPWYPQKPPTLNQIDLARNFDEETRALGNQFNTGLPPKESEYDSPVPAEQRLRYRRRDKWLLVKIYFFWPIYLVYYGFKLARFVIKTIFRIVKFFQLLPNWVMAPLFKAMRLARGWFNSLYFLGTTNKAFSALAKLLKYGTIFQIPFWSECPKKIYGVIKEDFDITKVAYMELFGFSRGCVPINLTIKNTSGSKTVSKRYEIKPKCRNLTRKSYICFQGIMSYNGPLTRQCMPYFIIINRLKKVTTGFYPHLIIGVMVRKRKREWYCREVGLYNKRWYTIFSYKKEFNEKPSKMFLRKSTYLVTIDLVPGSKVPPHLRLSMNYEDSENYESFYVPGIVEANRISGHFEASIIVFKDTAVFLSNFMIPPGHFDPFLSWATIRLNSGSYEQMFYGYMINVYTYSSFRPEFYLCLNRSRKNLRYCPHGYYIDRMHMNEQIVIKNNVLSIWQQILGIPFASYNLCIVEAVFDEDGQQNQFHRIEIMSLLDGRMLNVYIYNKRRYHGYLATDFPLARSVYQLVLQAGGQGQTTQGAGLTLAVAPATSLASFPSQTSVQSQAAGQTQFPTFQNATGQTQSTQLVQTQPQIQTAPAQISLIPQAQNISISGNPGSQTNP